jgi:hypothetical protein
VTEAETLPPPEDYTVTEQNGTASVMTPLGLSYTLSGYASLDKASASFAEELTYTFDETAFEEKFTRFTLTYTSATPVKVWLSFTERGRVVEEYYFLNAGEGTFSGLNPNFLKGYSARKLTKLRVEALTDDPAAFTLAGLTTEHMEKLSETVYVENERFKLGVELGWGGAVSSAAPVIFKAAYEGGEGDVVKGNKEAPSEPEEPTFDPDHIPVAVTPIPQGTVSDKRMVHDCETLDGSDARYVPVTLNTDKTFVKEGETSWRREGESLEYLSVRFDAMDVSDYMQDGYLHMWVFVTDYNLVGGNGQLELTSSGGCDKNELHWDVRKYITGTGWNEVFVPLAEGQENNPDLPFDPTGACFIRIFCGVSDGSYKTMYFDDIYFCKMK